MPLETIEFNDKEYGSFQANGNAARWAREFALQYCSGEGVDIGAHKKEWCFPGAAMIDPIVDGQHAMSFSYDNLDYIHSSHCLEHVKENWYNVLDYWLTKIKIGGIIFLYLPHKSQEYWLPKNNRKHIHSFTGKEIADYLRSLGHKVMRSGVDLNNSFVVVCERVGKEEPLLAHPNSERAKYEKSIDVFKNNPDNKFLHTHKGIEQTIQSITAELITSDCIWYNGKAYHL